jgi:hypothetical protein
VTRRDDMAMSTGGGVTPERGKGGDDVNWADLNLTGLKNEENPHSRYNWYKWTVKI